ncbi:GNAT family N-acetyltransferase [Amycolatopsis eburnea]|uniref:GNAT family N-acetyltransferase n=1 Tax=Amycolatopsis eburnea TaxID=2267691 RepID=A0A427SX19_9PSEU|nr:GNAT family N-acetyltransferase [Amycolatopsis eburnea]RSD09228.1 GNAT family N-acetyltransferase [Amycolatopsis eburnea]
MKIGPLEETDRERWETLARGYKEFYRTEVPDEGYERTWRRLRRAEDVFGCAARLDSGRMVGFAHYLFHANPWAARSCYLQDLFVAETERGRGVGRGLIEYVAQVARDHGAARLHWLTQQDNERARLLYDKVAVARGFISYDRFLD